MANNASDKDKIRDFFAMMMGAYAAMPEVEKNSLLEWEKNHLDGTTGTSDWPGWEKYIGKRPAASARVEPKPKAYIPPELRWKVWERDNFTCLHCGSRQNLSVDHIYPESTGGGLELNNLQTLCKTCNSKKGKKVQ